jgi:hypothetical protein
MHTHTHTHAQSTDAPSKQLQKGHVQDHRSTQQTWTCKESDHESEETNLNNAISRAKYKQTDLIKRIWSNESEETNPKKQISHPKRYEQTNMKKRIWRNESEETHLIKRIWRAFCSHWPCGDSRPSQLQKHIRLQLIVGPVPNAQHINHSQIEQTNNKSEQTNLNKWM